MKNGILQLSMVILSLVFLPRVAALGQGTDNYFTVEGEVEKPLKIGISELGQMQQHTAEVKDSDGNTHTYTGVRLSDILLQAGATLGSQLRGENLVKYVLVKAVDGYEVLYSLPEIDPEFTDNLILLAYQVDGKPLPTGVGPFRMVIPHEKRHARWIREINSIKISFSMD